MKECLDEGTLQSYFDGELPIDTMERTTVHLSSCVTCAAVARELEQETAILTTALAAEFDAPVPTELLRRRIDAAVDSLHEPVVFEKRSLVSSLAGLFSFSPQRALGYAGLIIVLAFAAIFAVVKMKSVEQIPENQNSQVAEKAAPTKSDPTPEEDQAIPPITVKEEERRPAPIAPRQMLASQAVSKPTPVRLLPGERVYLKTIAKLDSAIQDEKNPMRPALQVEYQRNLAVVDRAIAATRAAAKDNPNDPDAADFMFAAYQSKVDLLNTIADARVRGRSH